MGDYFVEVGAILARFEAVDFAYGQQALNACEDGSGILCVQQLDGDVEEVGPALGEVVGEDLL